MYVFGVTSLTGWSAKISILGSRWKHRNSPLEVLLLKGVHSRFTGEHTCQIVISIKLKSNFTEITLRHGCSSVNLLHIYKTPFHKDIWWSLRFVRKMNQWQHYASFLSSVQQMILLSRLVHLSMCDQFI